MTTTLARIEKLCGSPQREAGGGAAVLDAELTQASRVLAAQLAAALAAIHALGGAPAVEANRAYGVVSAAAAAA